MGCCLRGPRAEVVPAEGAGKGLEGRLGEGRRVGAMEEDVKLAIHKFVTKVRGAKTVTFSIVECMCGCWEGRCEM